MSGKDYLNGFNQERNNYIEQLKNGSNNILVAIRSRPMSQRELEKSDFEVVRILDERVVVLIDPGYEMNQNDVLRKNRNKEMQFAFDFAFDQNVSQTEIFEKTSRFLLDGVVEGFNATVFAYGSTGAGKTYTMVGTPDNPGIMSKTMNQLFTLIGKNSNNKYIVRVSYLEIYNENIKDLLFSEDRSLELREDPSQGVVVAGITEIECSSGQEIMSCLKVGNRNRSKEATEANEVSSRSHAVLQVQVEIKEKEQGPDEEVKFAKLSMVDLAGSERAANTSNRGIRMIEGAKINQSLLCLGNCIQALSQVQEKNNKNLFVPYRGSKLTRLLKDSLGGNCRTVMIANVSPSMLTFEDTYNTLNYANRAKNIKTNVSRNILNVENHLQNYAQIIQNLRNENDLLKKQLQDKQGINLPPINPGNNYDTIQNENLNKLEKMITKHFSVESDIVKFTFDVENQMDKVNAQIFSILQEQTTDKELQKEKIESFKTNLKNLLSQKEEYCSKYLEQVDKRNDLLLQIKQANFSQPNLSYIMSVYKQGQATIENLEITGKEKKSEMHSKQKEQQVAFLQQQIKLRDGMINDWKGLIQDSKLKNKISYQNLKNVEEVTENVKLNNNNNSYSNNNNNQSYNSNNQSYSPLHQSLHQTPKRRVRSQLSLHPVSGKGAKIISSSNPLKNRPPQMYIGTNEMNIIEPYQGSSIKSAKARINLGPNSSPTVQSILQGKKKWQSQDKKYN